MKTLNYNLLCPEAVDISFATNNDEKKLSFASPEQFEKYTSIRNAIRHAWQGYKVTILDSHPLYKTFLGIPPADDLKPLTKSGGGDLIFSSATLFDSLDTLYLAGFHEEFNEALDYALSLPFPLYPVKTFEYSIRILGGILGAYSVSGDERLLELAIRVADALLDGPFRSSPTALPRMYDVLAPSWKHVKKYAFWDWTGVLVHRTYAMLYRAGRDWFGAHQENSLTGVGTFVLEFRYLTKLTGDDRYKRASDNIYKHIDLHSNSRSTNRHSHARSGMVPVTWNVMNGRPINRHVGLGGGSDSYYEYLVKNAISTQNEQDAVDLAMDESFEEVLKQNVLVRNSNQLVRTMDGHVYPIQQGNTFEHLLCFVPGMIALYQDMHDDRGYDNDNERNPKMIAKDLLKGCWDTYNKTQTGLGPERALISKQFNHRGNLLDSGYYLRPEFVESVFVLHRLKYDDINSDLGYQEIAWNVFQSIEKYCKRDTGYAGLKDVNSLQSDRAHASKIGDNNLVDSMPSFFIAETLKYLLLTFAPEQHISLHDFVFTTEAHPLRQLYTLKTPEDSSRGQVGRCVSEIKVDRQQPVTPIFVVAGNLVILFVLYRYIQRYLVGERSRQFKWKKSL